LALSVADASMRCPYAGHMIYDHPLELIETVSPGLTRRLESLKAEIAQDQSVGAADENKIREFRDLTTDGGMDIL